MIPLAPTPALPVHPTESPAPGRISSLDVLLLGRDMLGGPSRHFEKLGDTFTARFLGAPAYMTRDPAWSHEVLVRQHASFVKDRSTSGLSVLLGRGLITNEGAAWRERRKSMQPHFQPSELEPLLGVFREEAETEIHRWSDGEAIDLPHSMARMSMRTVLRSVFGTAPDAFGEFERNMVAVMDYFAGVGGTNIPLPVWFPAPSVLRFRKARSDLYTALDDVIARVDRTGAAPTPLARMLASRDAGELTHEQLREEAMTLLLAGHETVALTMTYTLALLAGAPQYQREIAADVRESGVPQTLRDVQRPSATRRAMTESLRLYPVAWAVGREALEPVDVCGHRVEKGAQVYVHQWCAHRHPAWFDAPEVFVPERWTESFTASLPRGLYLPFGAGPRICIGNHFALAELTVWLSTIVSAFHVEAASHFPPPLLASVTARPREPVSVRVQRRG